VSAPNQAASAIERLAREVAAVVSVDALTLGVLDASQEKLLICDLAGDPEGWGRLEASSATRVRVSSMGMSALP
jgi:hypothetical protein